MVQFLLQGRVTLLGDMLSLMGALTIIGYLHAGRILRAWMPIFLYALPVTGLAAILLTAVSMLLEGTVVNKLGPDGVFGYLEYRHFWLVLYLAIGPGLSVPCMLYNVQSLFGSTDRFAVCLHVLSLTLLCSHACSIDACPGTDP